MKPGEHRRIADAAEPPLGDERDPVLMLFASGKTLHGTDAISFWDRFIFALGVAPDWCLPLWDEPRRGS